MELSEYFTFDVPGAKFMPSYKMGVWDGKIRLLNLNTGFIYKGLFAEIIKFAEQREYEITYPSGFGDKEFSFIEAKDFIESLNLPDHIEWRDYQIKAFVDAIRSKRAMMLSPTSSGKSMIIYLTIRYHNTRTLIIVPRLGLVKQLSKDFESYGYTDEIHQIFSGQDKDTDHLITVTTWQSIYRMPEKWFDQFGLVVTDEAHEAEAKSVQGILNKMTRCPYRLGFTGTLKDAKTHELVLTGLFGPVHTVTTTKELQDDGHVAQLKIKCIIFLYDEQIRKLNRTNKYQEELEFIVQHQGRNRFISNLATSLNGNTLVLFQFVEKHGEPLYNLIKEKSNKPVYFVSGKISGDIREEIRQIVETQTDAIIVASYQTFSTGINITSLKNIIFASPSKSRVRVLQSIGRVLRKNKLKDFATVYDLADNISWKSKENFTLQHFKERVKIYSQEQFEFKTYKVELQEKNSG